MPPALRRRAAVRAAQPARALATRAPLRRLLWALHRLKSGKPLRATDLAREFEVAVRTGYRDLDFLRDEWRVPLGVRPPLSQGELLAIYFVEQACYGDRSVRRPVVSFLVHDAPRPLRWRAAKIAWATARMDRRARASGVINR